MKARACIILFTLCACSPVDMPPEPEVVGRDSAGVRIVDNPGSDVPLAWSFDTRLSLGTIDEGSEAFHQIDDRSVVVDSVGTIYVLDKGNKRVAVFEESGAFVREFGHEGRGPADLFFPQTLWIRRGLIEILDSANDKIVSFTATGEFVASDEVDVFGLSGRIRSVGGDRLYDWTEGARSENADTIPLSLLLRTDSDATLQLASWEKRGNQWVEFQDCGVRYQFSPFFSPEIAWDAAGAVIAVNAEHGYIVNLFSSDRLVASVRRERFATEVSEADLHAAADRWTDFQFSSGRRPGARQRCSKDFDDLIRERRYEPQRQVIEDIALSPGGMLWIRQATPGEDLGPIDVFGEDGRYLGTLPPDAPFPIAFSPDGSIATIGIDELDVQHVVFWEIRTTDPSQPVVSRSQ